MPSAVQRVGIDVPGATSVLLNHVLRSLVLDVAHCNDEDPGRVWKKRKKERTEIRERERE